MSTLEAPPASTPSSPLSASAPVSARPGEKERILGADPPAQETVSILIPFDIGSTHIFRSGAASREGVNEEWERVFAASPHGWNTGQLPEFRKPLGWIASRCVGRSESVQEICKRIGGEVDEAPEAVRAVVFPLGIGVIILRVRLTEPTLAFRERFGSRHQEMKPLCRGIFEDARDRYRDAVKGSPGRPGLRPLDDVGRTTGTCAFDYLYPVFFTTHTPPEVMDESDYPRSKYGSANVAVGWGAAYALGADDDERSWIELDFLVALASWYSLAVMNRLATRYLLDAVSELAARRPYPRKLQSRAIRLTYMEGANASHPHTWTSRFRDLRLLESIQKQWRTGDWWTSVQERTQLLALHHEQVEAEASERRGHKFATFGALITALTLASAIADVGVLLPDGSPQATVFAAHGFAIALGIPVLVLILFLF